jgi:hypothetical protein
MHDNPLSNRDYIDINKAIRQLNDTETQIERAKKAGIECDEEDIRCKLVKEWLQMRKAAYFPDRP